MVDLPEQLPSSPILVSAALAPTAAAFNVDSCPAFYYIRQLTDIAEENIESLSKNKCKGAKVVPTEDDITGTPHQ